MNWWQKLSTLRFGLLLMIGAVFSVYSKLFEFLEAGLLGPMGFDPATVYYYHGMFRAVLFVGVFTWLWWPLVAQGLRARVSVVIGVATLVFCLQLMTDRGEYAVLLGWCTALAIVLFCSETAPSKRSGIPCPQCGFDLRGQSECRCPECGKQFVIGALRIPLERKRDGRRWDPGRLEASPEEGER